MKHSNDPTEPDRIAASAQEPDPFAPAVDASEVLFSTTSGPRSQAAVEPWSEPEQAVAAPPRVWEVAPDTHLDADVRPKPLVAIPLAGAERQPAFEQRFAAIVDCMQHGAWPQALAKLHALRADVAEADYLDGLIAEAQLKTELMEQWSHKIKGRRLTVRQEWFLRRSLPFMAVLGLLLGIAFFYQSLLAPSRQVLAQARTNTAQIQKAKDLVQTGDFVAAMALYQDLLERDPANQAAVEGLAEAQKQAGLAANYDIARHVIRRGNLTRAEALLLGIQATSPAYRDVDQQLSRLATLRQAEAAYLEAEEAFAQRRWLSAVQRYERAAQISTEYRTAEVQARLDEAYYFAAEQLLARWPTSDAGPEQARTYLRRAQNVTNYREAATVLLATLDVYFRGEQAVRSNNLSEAINLWRGIYDTQSGYLGGFLAEQLYRAYLTLAAQAAARGDAETARQLYALAAQLKVRDTTAAVSQLALLSAPTPTPTPLPTSTLPPSPVVYAPPPVPTATPTPAMQYTGWIAFRSTREGSELVYIMRPDGSNQQRAPEDLRVQMSALYDQERRSPDGERVAVVSAAPGRSDANIYLQDRAGQTVAMISDDNRDEYDPVWAPNGQWIAYVANHPGNDEIFLMRPDGSDKRQLTWNEWEWDKHPTWSPDSSQIAFFTNRTGPRQIWVMSYDGTNQRNISNNGYDDWDPVWLR